MNKIILAIFAVTLVSMNTHAQSSAPVPESRHFLLGKVENGGSISVVHYNDEDFVKIFEALGYPADDDLGRTGGFEIQFQIEGDNASFEALANHWLFTNKSESPDPNLSVVEEHHVLSLRSRLFRDQNGSLYIIIGAESTYRSHSPGLGVFIQDTLHKATGQNPRNTFEREWNQFYVNGLFGLGGHFDLVSNRRLDVRLKSELEFSPSTLFFQRSRAETRNSLGVSVGGNNSEFGNSWFKLLFFSNIRKEISGDRSVSFGGILSKEITLLGKGFEFGISASGWNSAEDRIYETIDNPSRETGIHFRFPLGRKK